jgi:hypothetical protein
MRLGEALAMCPQLELVEQDPATAEQAWEEILRRLEDAGFGVEPGEPGTVFFESKGVERLYGGLEPALKRALAAVGTVWDARAGAAERRFAALAAANVARPGQALIVSDDRTSWRSWEFARSVSLPGCRVPPLPNVWGRTAGAPGAWQGVTEQIGRTGGCRRDGRRLPCTRRSSSRKRSATS